MESYLSSSHFDLASPDGRITELKALDDGSVEALVRIENISPAFRGFQIDKEHLFFNFKSTLAQLGLDGVGKDFSLDAKRQTAEVKVHLFGIGPVAKKMLHLLSPGAFVGKLFAADPKRRVRSPDYLLRMFGRSDRQGRPLLSLGGLHGSDQLVLETIEGKAVAFLTLQEGRLEYSDTIYGFLPILEKALHSEMSVRGLLKLEQVWKEGAKRIVEEDKILLVKTPPLHIRTVFGRVVEDLLPQGFHHTSAAILDPTTRASGDVYELFGSSQRELTDIPLEFYTLEPHREHVFFADRDQLQSCLEQPSYIFQAFETAPQPKDLRAAVFIVKGDQLINLKPKDWISREPIKSEFPGLIHPGRQALMVERYIHQQPSYPFLKSIEDGLITSEGILLTRYFPSPLMKKMLIGDLVQRNLKAIYFEKPSFSFGEFFSHEDRSMLLDLAKFAIPVFWADRSMGRILQYVPKPDKDCGMFVPLHAVDTFLKATFFGVYGSNLMPGTNFEQELSALFHGLKELRAQVDHPLLHKKTPISLITGGGPGVMELGNRIAKSLNILSCANIVDFRSNADAVVNEQKQNPFIEAKMTYRIDRLVERQAEFNLDFPIFLTGGIGTDFEFALESVRRKVGSTATNPVLLFGTPDYWRQKITPTFQCNLKNGTIKGSEWISNCFFCVQTAQQALEIYNKFFTNQLVIGKNGPVYEEGFIIYQ
jgi:predicted Rossmann-fold nucleotide-binding protein